MDAACNFPELLALDLETAESIFASKRMTAGAPRPVDAIFESKSIQDLTEAKILRDEETLTYASTHNFLPSKSFAHIHAQADAMVRLSRTRDHGRSKSTTHATPPSIEHELPQQQRPAAGADGGQGAIFSISRSKPKQLPTVPRYSTAAANNASEWDTDSVDSFELPNISLSRRAEFKSVQQKKLQQQVEEQQEEQDSERQQQEQQEQQQTEQQKYQQQSQQEQQQNQEQPTRRERASSLDETNCHLFLQSDRYGDSSFHDSRDSYGSLYDSYECADDLNDSASTSSFGVSVPASARGRQQSVVTAATSVTSSGCRFSSQSRTLSAMGPYSPITTQRESLASCDRHVEFNLDTDIIDDRFRRDGSSSSAVHSNRSSHNSQKSSVKATSDSTNSTDMSYAAQHRRSATDTATERSAKDRILPVSPKSITKPPSRVSMHQSSWMSFDDNEDYDDEYDEERANGVNGRGGAGVLPSSVDDTAVGSTARASSSFSVFHGSLPPRPKTSVGHSENEKTDFSVMSDWTSKNRQSRMPVISAAAHAAPVTPATFIHVPQRYSSFGHQATPESFDRNALLFQQYERPHQHQSHRLRHLLSCSDASAFSDAPRSTKQSDRPKKSSSSHFCPDLYVTDTEKPTSPTTSTLAHSSAVAATNTKEEPPILLQRTVYRKPVPKPLRLGAAATAPSSNIKATRGQDCSQLDMAQTKGHSLPKDHHAQLREVLSVSQSDGNVISNHQESSVEPLLISQFDDDSESDHGDDNTARNDTDLFGDFEGAYNYDEGEDQIMMATMMPFSKQHPRSLRSRRSLSPLLETVPNLLTSASTTLPLIPRGTAGNVEETSAHLQSWIEHASKSQQELVQQPPAHEHAYQQQQLSSYAARPVEQGAFYEEGEPEDEVVEETEAVAQQTLAASTEHQDRAPASNPADARNQPQKSLQQVQPVPVFYQPGIVGIPLPREVVETLRVSVSCFPETMLSLSSFSIQTIRSYSRKVRRYSQADADSTYRLLMSPSSPTGLPPSPTSSAPFAPPLSPTSPTTTSFRGGSFDLGTGVTRAMTSSSSVSHSSRRFWKLPKKLANSRTMPNLDLFTNFRSSNNGYQMSSTGPPTPRLSGGRRGSRSDNLFTDSTEDDQSKISGLCFNRIFPTGSDYLCDALYAHIIAFNYISLLCPPSPPAAGVNTTRPGTATQPPSTEAVHPHQQPATASHTMTTLPSSATLFETAQQQRRQTIRVYVGSDVPLPSLPDFVPSDAMSRGPMQPLPLAPLDNINITTQLLSPSSTPPPSRGRGDDDGRMISRKAALLLGISETLDPDSHRKNPAAAVSTAESARSNILTRRYSSIRRRHLRVGSSISEAAPTADSSFTARAVAASKMIKKALPGGKQPIEMSKPIYEADGISIPIEGSPAPAPPQASEAATAATAVVPATTASDASMRDLQAGLHACISQLVATMKLTTGQLGNTLLNTEVAREIDPLFLRTLCELVRSEVEQF